MATKTNKTFDCVEMKRAAQEQIYEETKDMTGEQRRAYFREKARSGPFRHFWNRMKQRKANATED